MEERFNSNSLLCRMCRIVYASYLRLQTLSLQSYEACIFMHIIICDPPHQNESYVGKLHCWENSKLYKIKVGFFSFSDFNGNRNRNMFHMTHITFSKFTNFKFFYTC